MPATSLRTTRGTTSPRYLFFVPSLPPPPSVLLLLFLLLFLLLSSFSYAFSFLTIFVVDFGLV